MTLKKNEPLLSGNLIREAAKESLKKLYAVKPEHHQAKKSIFKRLFGG